MGIKSETVYVYIEAGEVRLSVQRKGAGLEFLVPDEYMWEYAFPVKELPKLIEALKKVE